MATEPLPKQAEETNMDAPKEIFLKDYKEPDYFFEKVITFMSWFLDKIFLVLQNMILAIF